MTDFTKHSLQKVFNIDKLITILYMEFSKDFSYEGESHDFWEFVYIDKGEMICTAKNRQFILKGGEIVFHKPKEFHNLTSNKVIAPNVSIVTFVCKSKYMKFFSEKIIKLGSEEKKLLSQITSEGLSAFMPADSKPPVRNMVKKQDPPFGSFQMVKILLEQLLIMLYRQNNYLTKTQRSIYILEYDDYPEKIKDIIKFMQDNINCNLKISDIAKKFNMSDSKLKKLFRFYLKRGIIDYYINLKISEAKKLIKEEELNYTEIADKLGFSTINYFSKQFKVKTRMTPTQYKQSIKD